MSENLPMPSIVFSIWSDYWLSQGTQIPPFHYYKSTMSGGCIFFAPLGVGDVKPFIKSVSKDPDYFFRSEGEALIDQRRFHGHWSAFSVEIRSSVALSTYLTQHPEVPLKKGWFN